MAAIFGFQIVLTLIAASILQKLSARFSIGRCLLCRKLMYFLHPSNEALKSVLQTQHGKSTKKKTKAERRNNDKQDIFWIPKQTVIPLDMAIVKPIEVLQLPYYVDFRWLIDFSCYTMIVFSISEIFCFVFPNYAAKELNLSIVWVFVLLVISLKSLAIITALYFRGLSVSGERSLCISFGAVCFLLTMVLFLISDNLLDIGLLEAHKNFTEMTAQFLKSQDLPIPKERSPILLYFLLSLMFGFLASFLTFPCLRYSRMYKDALRFCETPISRLRIHAGFFAPLVVLLLWIKPIAHDHLIFGDNAFLNVPQFESLRLWATLMPVLLRVINTRINLQVYLNTAMYKVTEMQKEGGRITNVEIQRMVAQIFYYLCVVGIQYFAPMVLLLSLTCILKVLGQYSWLDVFNTRFSSFNNTGASADGGPAAAPPLVAEKLLPSLAHLYTIFNVVVNRGVWNFFLVATAFIDFFGSLVGVIYITKFQKEYSQCS